MTNPTHLGVLAALSLAAATSCQWADVTPPSSPSGRSLAGFATLPNGHGILVGGRTSALAVSNETWSYVQAAPS